MEENSLAHYGVLGMKWGVRKDGKPQGFQYGKSAARKVKKVASKASDKVATKATKLNKEERGQVRAKKKERARTAAKRSLLSDEELDSQIKRLQKEKRLRELTNDEVSRGRKQATTVINTTGKKIAIGVGAALGTAAVLYIANKALDGQFVPADGPGPDVNPGIGSELLKQLGRKL